MTATERLMIVELVIKKIKELKADGTVNMSLDNLYQVVHPKCSSSDFKEVVAELPSSYRRFVSESGIRPFKEFCNESDDKVHSAMPA